MPTKESPLELMLARCGQLYTLPAVATEVLRLTDQPGIDAKDIRDCVQRDPALTAKLLRVVNSSIYGLSGEVTTLDQAIALMGVTPLRLLVLGFSLPDKLLDGLTNEALSQYWTATLTRASAARSIAELGWGRLGDEAFVAGMMQGIGQLALLQELGEEYARLVKKFSDAPTANPADFSKMEHEAIGFDHRTLSARMLREWKLPERIVEAIERQSDPETIKQLRSRPHSDSVCLARSLRLGELLSQLVSQSRLSALAELVDEGHHYCRLTRKQVNTLVEPLQQQVDQLADAMSLSLEKGVDYRQALLTAHAQLASTAEAAAGELLRQGDSDEQRMLDDLLGEAQSLSASMKRLPSGDADTSNRPAHAGRDKPKRPHHRPDQHTALASEMKRLVEACRASRQPLSLVLLEIDVLAVAPEEAMNLLRRWMENAGWADESARMSWNPLDGPCAAVLMPGVDRVDATKLWSQVAAQGAGNVVASLNAGVAGVAQAPPRFDPQSLIEAAQRCLEAARETAGSSIKGIEVY